MSEEDVRWQAQRDWNKQMEDNVCRLNSRLYGLYGKVYWMMGAAGLIGTLVGSIIIVLVNR